MNIIAVGCNIKNTPIEIIEKMTFHKAGLKVPLERLCKSPNARGAVILSTCNRVEVYAHVEDADKGIAEIKELLSEHSGLPMDTLEGSLYSHVASAAISHLFKVCPGLDSMVIGEPQVLGQIKISLGVAREFNCTSLVLNKLFDKAITVAKSIRSETAVGKSSVSFGSVAVETAKNVVGDLRDKTVLLVGAGEMGTLIARYFAASHIKTLLISSRQYERAAKLAEELNGEAVRFEEYPEKFSVSDIIITSTGATNFIITKNKLERVMRLNDKTTLLMDFALPRNIDPDVREIKNVHLYNIDDFDRVIKTNFQKRGNEIKPAMDIIDREVDEFCEWMESLRVVPLITSLKEKHERILLHETQKYFTKLNIKSDTEKEVIYNLTAGIMKKILHPVYVNIKKNPAFCNDSGNLNLISHLFELEK